MGNSVSHIHCEKAEELLNHLSSWTSKLELDQFIFRGLSNSNYELIPTALRVDDLDNIYRIGGDVDTNGEQRELESSQQLIEWKIIRKFYQVCDRNGLPVPNIISLRDDLHVVGASPGFHRHRAGDFWPPLDYLELLGLAQHHGLPTRLLDWSNDPMTACFMACNKPDSEAKSISVWALNRHLLGKISDSDRIQWLQFVTPSYYGNANLAAQSGTFTVVLKHAQQTMGAAIPSVLSQMPVDRLPLDQEVSRIMENNSQGISEAAMIKFSLQKSEISRLYGFLERMNYSVSKHFPGYQGVVDQLKYFKGSLPPLTPTSQPPSPP